MGKRRARPTVNDMKIENIEAQLKRHSEVLDHQNQMMAEQKQALEGQGKYLNEILLILGGSASLNAPGMRGQLKTTMDKVQEIDVIVQKMQSSKGKTTIVWADVRTKFIAILVGIGTLLSIAVALKDLIFDK